MAARDSAPRLALGNRLHAAVESLLEQASDDLVLDAISAPTGSGSLARLVANLTEVSPATAAVDPLASAQARAAIWRTHYAAATPLLDAGEVTTILGLTSSEALRKRDRAGTILALPLATGKYAYPAWQFVDGRVVDGLALVRRALGNSPPWVFAGQLDALRDADSDDSPTLRELLIAGRVPQAVRAASTAMQDGGA